MLLLGCREQQKSTSRASELEHKVALLEVECASLTQELQELEARNRRGQKKASEESNQILQIQAWQEEVERATKVKEKQKINFLPWRDGQVNLYLDWFQADLQK
ncbi:hypothetical protein HPP92_005577 [Vanilla planifolia]|uniref:Uncharacterized protein n=1 Tax=Vanilla planifolia TaxID=51239 RepID=A0A835RN48_VANPL|nr:hypothetical protein HPP92_005577 [Vanilla planifolia]